MKTRKFALLLLLCACGDDDSTRTPLDGGALDSEVASGDARIVAGDPRIAASLRKWQQLVSEHPGAYWYEEENCAPNMVAGRSTIVQVDAPGARVLGTRTFPRTECIAQVNRFGDIDGPAPSFPRLHEVCAALLKQRSDTRFSTDAQGIIETCFVPDAPSCKDNCGSGFALRGWGFGSAPAGDAGVAGDACLPLPCPSNAPWNANTCRCAGVTACDVAGELARRAGTQPIDCGDLPAGADNAALMSAQKCVLDAAGAKQAFKLKVQWQGIDSLLFDLFAGDGQRASILHDDSGPAGLGETLSAELCESLEVDPQCLPQNGELCLRCKGPLESSLECTAQRPDGECHTVGDYEAGKEGSYRPCCPGLREVFQQRQSEDGSGNKVCADLPLRISSCIEGRCGDGRCEDQERNPCGGCTLDCQ